MDTFSMQGFKVYVTGESYAGQYIPYIAGGMLDANDTTYFNVKGVQINDPSINHDDTMLQGKQFRSEQVPYTNGRSTRCTCTSILQQCHRPQ